MSFKVRKDRCINPYEKDGVPRHKGMHLRQISQALLAEKPNLPKNAMICNDCRLKRSVTRSDSIMSVDQVQNTASSMEVTVPNSDTHEQNLPSNTNDESSSTRLQHYEELLQGLKDKFASLENGDPMKLQILTIPPESWSIRKLANEFNTSYHMAKKAKQLRSTHGVLADPLAKAGRHLPDSTAAKVIEFYQDDNISRIMPGRKDTCSIKVGDKRIKMQKRFLLMDLKELHTLFKKSYPDHPISFSVFAKLRPQYCVLAGARETHSVCVCTIHQNCKLMLDAINIKTLTKGTKIPMSDYHDCLKLLVCKHPTPQCYLDQCHKCPDISTFSTEIFEILTNASIDQVQYTVWTATDRSTLNTVTADVSDFVEELCDKLQILKPHSYIAKQQSEFIASKKENLKDGEVLVMFDFSENFAYVVQDASQAFHFNNDQCTVFPVIYYYKENSVLKHKSAIFLSSSLKHDTSAVYTIQKQLIPEIRVTVKNVKKFIYMTDGAKQHFKNRFQIANLLNHKEDFEVDAEWHYCVTAHGKSGYDGLGAIFKREAYQISLLRKPTSAILTPEALFDWARSHFKNIKIFYFSKVDHDKSTRRLNKRFGEAPPIPEILKNHSFTIKQPKTLIMKRYSNAATGVEFTV